jgi:ribosomal protein L19E
VSARRQIIAALSEDSMGGIATLHDVAHAEQLVDAHRTEVIAKAISRLRAIPITCTALTGPVWYGDGWSSAITVLEEIAEYQTPDDEAYPGELQRLRALVLGLRVAALRKEDMAQVQWLLTDHEETREKATAPAATATPAPDGYLPSWLTSIGLAGSETERALYQAYEQAMTEVRQLRGEKATSVGDQPTAGEATPGLNDRQTRLLDAIRSQRGHWKTGRVLRFCQQNNFNSAIRTARFDLTVLRDAGHITQHDTKGVRFYTYRTKDSRP